MRFGILGTADIARDTVAPTIRAAGHRVVAIASRDYQRASATADDLDVPSAFGSYEELLEDEDLDAVYNPLPNSLHTEWTERAAQAGLHVLCEKPLAVDATEARSMHEQCENEGVVLMEGFMYRYHPRIERAAALVEEAFDDVRSLTAAFQFPLRDPDDIRLDPDLGGGASWTSAATRCRPPGCSWASPGGSTPGPPTPGAVASTRR